MWGLTRVGCDVCGRRVKALLVGGKYMCVDCYRMELERLGLLSDAKKAMAELYDELKREVSGMPRGHKRVAKAMLIYAKYERRLRPLRFLLMAFLLMRKDGEGDGDE